MSTKKTTRTELLPQLVFQAIQELNLKGFHYANVVQIVGAILRLKNRERLHLEDYKTISSTYFESISQNYSAALSALKRENIVQVFSGADGKQYSTVARVAKAYRINPELISDTEVAVEFKIKAQTFRTSNLSPDMESWIQSDLKGLQIDAERARQATLDYVELLDLSEWQITAKSPEYTQDSYLQVVRFGIDPRAYRYKTRQALDDVLHQPQNRGKALFRHGDDHVIDFPSNFRSRKNRHILSFWNRSIHNLEKGQLYATKVEVNHRIHTNLTEFPGDLLDLITYDGQELQEVDVANSQMACLAHVMFMGDVLQEGIDFPVLELTAQSRAFIEGCQSGTLYGTYAQHLNLTRSAAKTEMFRQVFGGVSKSSQGWRMLQAHYAPIAAWLETVKTRGINLAHYLQRLEAWVMMENVYPAIKRAGLVAFGKHDSFLVPESQVSAVEALIQAEFQRLNFRSTLKNKTNPPLAITPAQKQEEESEYIQNYIRHYGKSMTLDTLKFLRELETKYPQYINNRRY